MKKIIINVKEDNANQRIDSFLADEMEQFSRSYLKNFFESGNILVNGRPAKASLRLKEGDEIDAEIPDNVLPDIVPEDIPLDILYEDKDLLVVNKPKNMVVHPAAGHYSGTLVNALMFYCGDELSGINGVLRPGIVHRIDKDTTGSLIVCKTDTAHNGIAALLAVHSIDRKYRSIVHGHFSEKEFTIDKPIGRSTKDRKKMAVTANGRPAVTKVSVLEELNGFSYIECTLFTGRTHQIRVHLSHLGHPVLGDEIYGPAKCPVKGLSGQCLHAYFIGFPHPVTGERIEVTAPLPEYFLKLLSLYKIR